MTRPEAISFADRVRTRLLAGFFVLLLVAIALAAIGWIGMRSTQQALSGFEAEVVPNIAQALELAERTARVAAIAPHLAESRTRETLDINAGVVRDLLGEIRQRSVDLPSDGELRPVLDRLLEGVDRDLGTLITLTQGKQLVQERLHERVAQLEQLGAQIHARERRGASVDPAISSLWASLVLGASSDTEAVLGRIEADVEALLVAARERNAFSAFDKTFDAALVDVASGPENVLALRRSLREFERRTDYLVAITRANADELNSQVARRVAQLRGVATQRSDRVAQAVRSGETTMLVLAVACLAVAIGATHYVRRLLAQIENITMAMSRLARGDTGVPAVDGPPLDATRRRDELGALARAFDVFRENLIARQQLLKDVNTQRELLEAVHNSMTDGVAVFDADNRLLLWNPQVAQLLGRYSLAPREGLSLAELLACFPAETTWVAPGHTEPRLISTAKAGDFAGYDHVELRLPDGRVYDLRTRVMPGGGTVTLTTDLTDRRAIDMQMQQAQRLEVLGQLTGGVAHDFNNYLGTILGNLALLESDGQGGAQLQRAQLAATRAAALTRRLLAFARRQPLQSEHVPVDDMIEEMRDLIEYSAGGDVVVALQLAAPASHVYVDRGQLENALLNLVINSAAAMPQGGRLDIATRRIEDDASRARVELSVADMGTGIPEHLQGRVFEPFFTTKSEGGSGLGLSIVYGFVKQSGGTIALTSKQGQGTTVTMTFLESRKPADVEPHDDGAGRGAVPLADRRVLLVDDDEAFRITVQEMLAAAGMDVVTAASAEEALQRLAGDGAIDAVLSDVRLGDGMNGIALVRAIRKRAPDMAVALMSGMSPELFANHADWDATVPFLRKPFEAKALLACLA